MPQKFTPNTVMGGLNYLLAAGAYYTGYLETLRQRAIEQQDLTPWQILRYQRVLDPTTQPYPILPTEYTTPERFRIHMRYLAKHCNVVTLAQLVEALETGQALPDKSCVITFDSGWRDSFTTAFPILREFNLPATLFLATAFIDTNNLFWTDKFVASMIFLESIGVQFPDIPALRDQLPPLKSGERTLGHVMARIIYILNYLRNTTSEERATTFAMLGVAIEAAGGLPLERVFLSWEEIREMSKSGITFASNGHSHKLFTEFRRESGVASDAHVAADVKASIDAMRQAGITPLNVFAYPEGDITKEGRDLLAKHGIRYSVGIGSYPRPKLDAKSAAVLGRIPIYESIAYCKEVFACRLWQVRVLGEAY